MSTILVVDDNPLNLKLTCITLELAGHETLTATNGREAIAIVLATKLDLILMDLRMPVLDGKLAMEAIKANVHLRHIPIVVLTASAMKGEREHLLQCGFDGYIDKPIDVTKFADTVAKFLKEVDPSQYKNPPE